MNGYKLHADSYRAYLERTPNEPNKAFIENQIRMLDFLATCQEEDFAELYDSGAFNDITTAYCKKAMQNVGLTEEQVKGVIGEIRWLHDTVGARNI